VGTGAADAVADAEAVAAGVPEDPATVSAALLLDVLPHPAIPSRTALDAATPHIRRMYELPIAR
jgi:hypothetical protein